MLTSFSLTPSRHGLEELEKFILSAPDEENPAPVSAANENSPTDAIENDQNVPSDAANAPSSPKTLDDDHCVPSTPTDDPKSVESEPSSLDKANDKEAEEPAPPANDEAATVQTDEPDVLPASLQVVPTGGDILSMATDTKLKSDGAVDALVKGYCAEVETLDVDESTKADLSSILRYQRFRSLSWDLDWSELKTNCEHFLADFEIRGFEDVELKYLDIDYNQFKDTPFNEDDYIGIEKGYEHFADVDSASYVASDFVRSSSVDTDDDEFTLKRRKKVTRRDKFSKKKKKTKHNLNSILCTD